MKIEEIVSALDSWDNVRNSLQEGYPLLSYKGAFGLTKEQFDAWRSVNAESEKFLVYLGVYNNAILFFISPREIDLNLDPMKILICHPEVSNNSSKISEGEALRRIVRWAEESLQWFKSASSNKIVVRHFEIGREDLSEPFDVHGAIRVDFYKAINNHKVHGDHIELIVSSTGPDLLDTHYYDLSVPKPPF